MVTYHGSQLLVAAKATTPAYTDASPTIDFSYTFDRDVKEVYEHGDPAPQELKPGHHKISGTIKRNFETGNFSAAGVTFAAMCMGTTSMHLAVFLEGDALPKDDIEDCIFSNYQKTFPLDDLVQESASFKGLLITPTA